MGAEKKKVGDEIVVKARSLEDAAREAYSQVSHTKFEGKVVIEFATLRVPLYTDVMGYPRTEYIFKLKVL